MKTVTHLLCTALLLAGCGQRESEKPEMVLRTYEVPSGSARELRNALTETFGLGSKDSPQWIAKATVTPDGRLAVLAPARLQEGVKATVDEMVRKPAAAPATIEISYWLVHGVRAEAAAIGAEMQEIRSTLEQVANAQGPMRFSLVERLKVASLSGESGDVSGRLAQVFQSATVAGESILAHVTINPEGGNKISTTLKFAAGQTIVLGESGYSTPGPERPQDGAGEGVLYYVIRASLPDGAGKKL